MLRLRFHAGVIPPFRATRSAPSRRSLIKHHSCLQWENNGIGEPKTLLKLPIGDEDAIRAGRDWTHHFNDLAPSRRLVYRCMESMLNVDEVAA